ncbi:acyltransferase family protein [Actinophytocola sediminis]
MMSVHTTTVQPRQGAKRVPRFEGVRGLCALALLITHVAFAAGLIGMYDQPPSSPFAGFLINGFPVCVGVFFTLSGMFLYRPFARSVIAGTPKPLLGPYFLRRGLRLLPAYYLMTVAALLTLNLNYIDGLWYVLRPFLLMQNYEPTWMAGMDITWTVTTEVHFYLAMPLIAWLCHRYARRGVTAVQRARRLMLPVPILILAGFGWSAYVHSPEMGQYPNAYWLPITNVGVLAIGMAMGVLSALSEHSPGDTPALFRGAALRPNLFWLGAFVVYLLNAIQPFGRPAYGDYPPLAAGLVQHVLLLVFPVLLVAPMIAPGAQPKFIDAVLANGPVRFLGRISYGVYLWQFVVLYWVLGSGSVFGNEPAWDVRTVIGDFGFWELELSVIALTVVVATVSYYAFERPLMLLGERRISRRAEARKATEEPAQPAPV